MAFLDSLVAPFSSRLLSWDFTAQPTSVRIEGKSFDMVVCAGAPAQKWIANREPETDREKIEGLINHLKSVQCKTFILISTVDVFKNAIGVDEDTSVDETGLHAYGLHGDFWRSLSRAISPTI